MNTLSFVDINSIRLFLLCGRAIELRQVIGKKVEFFLFLHSFVATFPALNVSVVVKPQARWVGQKWKEVNYGRRQHIHSLVSSKSSQASDRELGISKTTNKGSKHTRWVQRRCFETTLDPFLSEDVRHMHPIFRSERLNVSNDKIGRINTCDVTEVVVLMKTTDSYRKIFIAGYICFKEFVQIHWNYYLFFY